MQDFIFQFDEKQMSEYLKLKEEKKIPNLSPYLEVFSLPTPKKFSLDKIIRLISDLTDNSIRITKENKEEWKEKLTQFYFTVEKINSLLLDLNEATLSNIEILKEYEKILLLYTQKYSAFLPCLVAFGEIEEIKNADNHLKEKILETESKMNELSKYILSTNEISNDILVDFFEKAERSISKYEGFSQSSLNLICNSAIERIKAKGTF